MARKKGVIFAIQVARKMNEPYLLDILHDIKSRKMLWSKGAEVYYPLGMNDPDYTVLRFTAKWGNYYHALSNVTFEL
jgi:general stress protein 26